MGPLRKLFTGRFAKIVLGIILVLVICVVGFFSFVWNKLDLIQYSDEIDHQVLEVVDDTEFVDIGDLAISDTAPVIPDTEIIAEDNIQNILVLGTDERTKNFNYSARSDAMILVSINKDLETVRLVSFERAIGVPILEGELQGQYDLLTHIFRWGGSDLVVKTIEHCFKIDIDHYVRVNFNSVRMIVDTIGGINLNLTGAEATAINENLYNGAGILGSGENHLNGEQALSFARLRRIDSDWKRVERQRKVILAVVDALKGSSLLTLNDLADTVLPMVQTDMSKFDIAELVLYAPNFLVSEFDQMTIPKQGTYGGIPIRNNSYGYGVDYEINNDILYRFLYEGASSEALLEE